MTDLSIIIVSYKGWPRLTKCLEALDSFTGRNLSYEVIIVDNRSDDYTINKFEKRFSRFKFIHNQINGGFANGCNLGADSAAGEFLLFLNPDTVATESELEKLLEIAKKNPSFGIVSCRQINEHGKESVASGSFPHIYNLTGLHRAILRNRRAHAAIHMPDVWFPDWISGSVILMRKVLFQKINGFDEDFWMYFEDVDLCKRVRNLNYEVACCANILIEHNHGGSSRINLKTASLTKTEVHISRHVYISKHKRGIDKIVIQIFLVINNSIAGLIAALLGMIFFFIPKAFLRVLIFTRLVTYYFESFIRSSWISPRSVNFKAGKSNF